MATGELILMTYGQLAYLTAMRMREGANALDDWWELTDECRKNWNVQAHNVLLTHAKELLTHEKEI